MRYVVPKSGLETFDSLHALGLAALVAESSDDAVEICDCGVTYEIATRQNASRKEAQRSLQDILDLPSKHDFVGANDLQLANLDGLLVASFTMPGARLVSVADVRERMTDEPDVVGSGLAKCTNLVARLQKSIQKHAGRSRCWMDAVLRDYEPGACRIPVPRRKGTEVISISMPLEPAFGYATRRPLSDGIIGDRTNVVIEGASNANALTYIGAARFLRGQRVSNGKFVNLYVPLVDRMTVTPATSLQGLFASRLSSEQAAFETILWLWKAQTNTLKGVGYQVLQTQQAKQSISIQRRCLSFSLLNALTERGCNKMITRWRRILGLSAENSPIEVEYLVEYLASGRSSAWYRHLMDVALHQHFSSEDAAIYYNIQEVKTMVELHSQKQPAISSVLEREQGTLYFGRALRLLSNQNWSAVRELIEDLETVHTRDQLIRVLARSVQECQLAKAKTEFIIIPTDDDLSLLLDDIDQFGARDIAGLLIILAALRYPNQQQSQAKTTGRPTVSQPIQTQSLPGLEETTNG